MNEEIHWQLLGDLDSCIIRDSTTKIWISKYCSDSCEAESHREKNLVNDILLMRRYLATHISPMTLPMDKDNELFLDTLNIRATQADQMSVVR